jgi:hypothetical protein
MVVDYAEMEGVTPVQDNYQRFFGKAMTYYPTSMPAPSLSGCMRPCPAHVPLQATKTIDRID